MAGALGPWCRGLAACEGTADLALGAVAGRMDQQAGAMLARSADRTLLLVASARIDNRAAVARALGEPATATTAGLLLNAWRRWGTDLLDELAGDSAIAVADVCSRELWLMRLPLSLRSLFYRVAPDATLFASHPAALFSVPGTPKTIDWRHASLRAAQYSLIGRSTMFTGIERVRPGEVVHIRNGEVRTLRLWAPHRSPVRFRSLGEAGEALRSTFDEAVCSHLACGKGRVAAYLSSGRDSSAVVTSAAVRWDRSEPLLAFTGAPREGFADPSGPAWRADESDVASTTVAAYPAVRHRIVRPGPGVALQWLRRLSRFHHQPITNFSNTHWWVDINDAAQAAGARIMLSGAAGNFTISAGPMEHLSDVAAERGSGRALAAAIRSGEPLRAARALLAPKLPPSVDHLLRRLAGRPAAPPEVSILRQPYRSMAEEALASDFADLRPAESGFALRASRLLSDDASDPFFPAIWGMEQRDPTADRRVVDRCFSMPAEYLVPHRDDPRPLYKAAFGSRVPEAVVLGEPRGIQGADWFEQFPVADVRAYFAPLLRNRANRELFDVAVIEGLLNDWPVGEFADPQIDYLYPCLLLNALALADFIDLHWPD